MRTPVTAGALTALLAGAIMVALAVWGGALASSLVGIVGLTAPLVAGGVLYGRMVQMGRLREGLAPGVVFWAVAFPLARILQEMMLGFSDKGIAGGVWGFAAYQAMVGAAFGLGFGLLHGQIWTRLSPEEEESRNAEEQGAAG